jgi:hypothetical protein
MKETHQRRRRSLNQYENVKLLLIYSIGREKIFVSFFFFFNITSTLLMDLTFCVTIMYKSTKLLYPQVLTYAHTISSNFFGYKLI